MKKRFMKLSFKKKAMIIVLFELLCLIIVCIPITIIYNKGKKTTSSLYKPYEPSLNIELNDLSITSDIDSEKYELLYSYSDGIYFDNDVFLGFNKCHVIVDKDGKNLIIDGKIVYSGDQINSLYLFDDVLVFNVSGYKDKLISVDFRGNINIIDECDESINIAQVDGSIYYDVVNHNKSYGEIYLLSRDYQYVTKYLGSNKFENPRYNKYIGHYSECIKEYNGYCLLNDDNKFKIEMFDLHSNSDGSYSTELIINGKALSFTEYYVDEIRRLDDNYLYVSLFDAGIGYNNETYIINTDGDIVNKVSNYVSKYGKENIYFENNNSIVYSTNVLIDGPILGCQYFKENNFDYGMDVYKVVKFKYTGKGRLSITSTDTYTLREYLKEATGYDNCDDLLKAWDKGDFRY